MDRVSEEKLLEFCQLQRRRDCRQAEREGLRLHAHQAGHRLEEAA